MLHSSLINLESILSLGSKLNESLDVDFIMSSSLLSLMGKLVLKKGCGFVRDGNSFQQVVCKGANEEVAIDSYNFTENQFSEIKEESPLYNQGYRYIINLKSQQKIIGLILLGQRLLSKELSDDEIKYIQIVGSITSTALSNTLYFEELKSERDIIQRQNLLLRTLIDISNDFKNITSREHILRLFSLYLKGNLRINRHAIYLTNNNETTQIVNDFNETLNSSNFSQLINIPVISFRENLPSAISKILPKDVSIVAPLNYHGEIKGYLLVGSRLDKTSFLEENLTFIELLANSLITALENNRLFLEELEKEKLERELNLAKEIQNNLLPKSNPAIVGWDVVGKTIPSKKVGGDYFDIIELSQNEYLFIIADISGKGIPAALLMSNLQASIRTLISLNLQLPELVERVNALLFKNTTFDKFATMFIAKLNLSASSLQYINAGHNPPIYIKSNGTVKQLSEGCLLLGVVDDLGKIEMKEINLSPNELVLIYTDGINEALNTNYEEFGTDRMIENIMSCIQSESKIILETIYSNVKLFSVGMEQSDDMTAIIIKKV